MVLQHHESQQDKERGKPGQGSDQHSTRGNSSSNITAKIKNQLLKIVCRTLLTRQVDALSPVHKIMNVTQNKNKQQETMYIIKKKQEELNKIKQKVLNRQITYMVADSGATSSCGRMSNPFIRIGQPSTNRFHTPFRQMAQATEIEHLHLQVQELAKTVDIVPRLKHSSLLSINKFTEANYVTMFTPDRVAIFDRQQARISSTHWPIIQGWRDPETELWIIPIEPAQTATHKYAPTPAQNKKTNNQHMRMNNM